MYRFLIAISLILGLISAAAPAARSLDPDALRQDIIAGLNRGITTYRTGPYKFTSVETVAQGAAVRVKITDLTLPLPDFGGRIEFGDLAFTLADAPPGPLAGDRRYLVSEVTAASRMAVIDDTGEETVLINYRLERLSGVWSTALRSSLDYDLAVDSFEVLIPEENLAIAIDRLALANQTVIRGDGLADIEGEGSITGLRLIQPAFGTLRIGDIPIEVRGHGYDLASILAFNEAFDAVGNRAAAPDRDRIVAILERLKQVNMLGQGLIERFKLIDVSYLDAAQQPRFHLDEMEFDLAGGDLHLAFGYVSLGLRMAGIQVALPGVDAGNGAGNPFQALTPEHLSVIVSLERAPIQAWFRSIMNLFLLAAAAGEKIPDSEAFNKDIGAEFKAAINEAGTVLRLDRLDIVAPSGALRAEGAFTVDPATAIGLRGGVDLTITGLDEMIAAATGAGQAAPEIQGQMMFLYLLKGMAKREPGPDGKPVDRLEISVNPAGEVLLNGLPFPMMPPQ